jgi:hypothetical protein
MTRINPDRLARRATVLTAAMLLTLTPAAAATAATGILVGCASSAGSLPEGFQLLEDNGLLTCTGGRWVFESCDSGTNAYRVGHGRVFCS